MECLALHEFLRKTQVESPWVWGAQRTGFWRGFWLVKHQKKTGGIRETTEIS